MPNAPQEPVAHPLQKSCLHRYQVPVVGLDLPPAEALSQSLDALKHLDGIINDIFARLSTRVKEERSRITSVCDRVVTAKARVDVIGQNQDKATTIYSSAKYPAPKILPDFNQLAPAEQTHELSEVKKTVPNFAKAQRSEHTKHVDTTELFYELARARAAHIDHEMDAQSKEGLGRLPTYLPSVSSILLFNSDENLYKKYQSINNLEGVGGTDRAQESGELAAAPSSLLEGAVLPTFAGVQFEYKPMMEALPTFDLPANLQFTSGGTIASNLNFGGQQSGASIAPSVVSLPMLPTVESLQGLPAPNRVAAPSSSTSSGGPAISSSTSGAPPAPASSSAPPPPPPP